MKRSIAMALILTIVTCGFYGIYWMIVLNDDLNRLAGKPNATSGVMVLVLTLVTCGIYGYYWMYKMGETVDFVNARTYMSGFNPGINDGPINAQVAPTNNSGIIYLVLSIFGLGIINYCLMQDAINKNVG